MVDGGHTDIFSVCAGEIAQVANTVAPFLSKRVKQCKASWCKTFVAGAHYFLGK